MLLINIFNSFREVFSFSLFTSYDDRRSHDIEKLGIKILRFNNNEVFTDLKKIIEEIFKTIAVIDEAV